MSETPANNNVGRIVIIVIVVIALLIVAGLAYIFISGGSGEASQEISAPTLAADEASGEATTFTIVPEESEVRFSLDEVLNGSPFRVVGTTNQVAGQISVNFADPELSEVGIIRINVRTLATDSELRNRAIRGQILQSAEDEFEFAQFEPTRLENFDPTEITMGAPINFEIVGNLTVRNITHEERFAALVTPVSETRLEGTVAATVSRATYELQIPNVPNVADVSDSVLLELDFVAVSGGAEATPEATEGS